MQIKKISHFRELNACKSESHIPCIVVWLSEHSGGIERASQAYANIQLALTTYHSICISYLLTKYDTDLKRTCFGGMSVMDRIVCTCKM